MECSEPRDGSSSGVIQGNQDAPDESTGYLSSLGGDEWDPELLLVAMAGGIGDLNSSHSAEANVTKQQETVQSKKKKRNYNPNKARNERRDQLIELRCEVKELESKRALLHEVRDQRESNKSYQGGDGGTSLSVLWKEVCVRQLDQRLRAERENVHLKKLCEMEMQLVENLKKQLYREPARRSLVCLGARTRARRIDVPSGYVSAVAAQIFDELETRVENSYRDAEFVVEVNSPAPVTVITQTPLLRGTMSGRNMEVFDHHVVPFGICETGEAWWQHWHNYRGRDSADTASNVVIESFGLEFKDLEASKKLHSTFNRFYGDTSKTSVL